MEEQKQPEQVPVDETGAAPGETAALETAATGLASDAAAAAEAAGLDAAEPPEAVKRKPRRPRKKAVPDEEADAAAPDLSAGPPPAPPVELMAPEPDAQVPVPQTAPAPVKAPRQARAPRSQARSAKAAADLLAIADEALLLPAIAPEAPAPEALVSEVIVPEVVVPEAAVAESADSEPETVSTTLEVTGAVEAVDLAQYGRREFAATGEPISGDRRRNRGRSRGGRGFQDAEPVFVPEAVLEAAPTLEQDLPASELSADSLPLSSLSGNASGDVDVAGNAAQQGGRSGRRDRGRRGDRDRNRGDRTQEGAATSEAPPAEPGKPPRRVPVGLPALSGPGFVLVPEATLEAIPEDWAEEFLALEDQEDDPQDDPQDDSQSGDASFAGGRRRRRRGRDRRDETSAPSKPVGAAPSAPSAPSAASLAPAANVPERRGPIVTLHDDDNRAERDRRDRESREVRDPREYKELLVNVADRETRIAVLENGRLVELHVEREERVVGGVYKGRVCNVLPGMDAAFVDIGLERNAFLYVGDILFDDAGGRESGRDSGREPVGRDSGGRESGGRGRGDQDAPQRRTSRDARISDLAKSGQEILVQVVKGPRGTKGARVSTKISIPGRYLVLMPEGDHLGVSRKVEDGKERERLRRIGEQLKPKGFGLIIRTEAEGRSEQELKQDLDYLVKSWGQISERNKRTHAPVVLHRDLGIILKTIRDLFGQDTDKLVIDSVEEHEKIVETLNDLAPDLVDRVVLYDHPEPLFSKFNLEEEIDKLLRRKVWLRNGAYLLIDTTEALTTIDVNTGKFVGTSSLAETILKTNLDAVDEIARQLRLRDIGGMIVLDFIDMSSSRDRQHVMRKLEDAFKKDRTRIKIAHISPLGLVEMTRKRTSEAVTDVMTDVCTYCQGRGRTWSPETMAINIERDILRLCAKQEVDAVIVTCNPDTAIWLIGPEGEGVERLERIIRRPVYIRGRQECHVEKFEVQAADMMEMERQMMPFRGGQVVEALVTKGELVTPPRSAAWVDGYLVDLANGSRYQGQRIRVRLTDVRRSYALGDPVAQTGWESDVGQRG